jgi:hypothetical protein
VGNRYSLDLAVTWDIRAQIDELFPVEWNVVSAVRTVDLPVAWDVRGLKGMDLPVIWNIIPSKLVTLYSDDIQLPVGSVDKT